MLLYGWLIIPSTKIFSKENRRTTLKMLDKLVEAGIFRYSLKRIEG